MTTAQPPVPTDGAAEADLLDQHQLADDTPDDGSAVPVVDLDVQADLADLQEQATPAPLDDDDAWR